MSQEASQILDHHTSTSNILKRRGKNPSPIRPKNGRGKKNIGVINRYALTRKRKNLQRLYFNKVDTTGALYQLFLRIAESLINSM